MIEDDRAKHERLLAKIAAGEKVETRDTMSQTYYDNLVHLMTMQADSELAGAYGYVPWIMRAPSVEEKLVVAQIVKDETRHAKVMYDLLSELGVDVQRHVGSHDEGFAARLDDAEADIGTARLSSDKRVNIFYYPINSWADFVMFNFCMDRGAGHQLEDVRHSSYGPWRRAVEGIFKEEKMHIRHGELWLRRLAENPTTREEAERTFHKWYVRTMNIFGRPATPKNRLYRELGLKTRDNDAVRQAFTDEVRRLVEPLGWRVPEWRPNWEKLPDEAQIPG